MRRRCSVNVIIARTFSVLFSDLQMSYPLLTSISVPLFRKRADERNDRLQQHFLGPTKWAVRHLMSVRNITCLIITTMMLGNSITAFGQSEDSLDIAAALDAFTLGRQWIDSFDNNGLPPPESDQAAMSIPGATGVSVILRRAGHVIALASDSQQDQWMLRRAIGRALSQVLGSAQAANLPRDLRDGLAEGISLELEIAGPMQPILATNAAQLNSRLKAGRDGLALRHQESWFIEFPAAARAFNRDISSATLAGLLGDAGLPPRPISELARQTELGVYRFSTLDLAQRSPLGLPMVLEQGDIVVEASSISPSRIAQAADEIASHLLTTAWPGPEPVGLLGGYNPVTDSYIPLIASDEDQLLVALALRCYARTPRVNQSQAQEANALAEAILTALATRREDQTDTELHPTLASFIVLAWADLPPQEANAARLHQTARDTVLTAVADPSAVKLGPHDQAILVSAMTRLALKSESSGVPPLTIPSMSEWIDTTWQQVPEHQHVSLQPWMGWAVIDMQAITGQPTRWDNSLRQQRVILQAAQRGREGALWAPALSGGFPLGSGTQAQATAQGLRPAVLLATMLSQPHLTNQQELATAMESQLGAARFLVQLMHRQDTPHQPRTPKRALGGVRAALWDQNQPSAAQAMGLIMVCETLQSLQKLTKQNMNRK